MRILRSSEPASVSDWHPDVDTAVVWSDYGRKQRRADLLHRVKVAAAVVVLTGLGFVAVLGIDWALHG